jgi:DNA-directed RNA polymerase subunit alpha
MSYIALPTKTVYTEVDAKQGKIEVHGCYPGYGATLGNALRRVLLSSLGGAAVVSYRIAGVTHEFSTVAGVLEDNVRIGLALKQLRVRLDGAETATLMLKAKGEKVVTAADIDVPAGVTIVSPDQVIATLTDKKAELDMTINVASGIGFVPVEAQERGEQSLGDIALDAIYTPIKRVNYEVENMRVGKRTDFDKVTLDITTDGSISPKEAFDQAVRILIDQFSAITVTE